MALKMVMVVDECPLKTYPDHDNPMQLCRENIEVIIDLIYSLGIA